MFPHVVVILLLPLLSNHGRCYASVWFLIRESCSYQQLQWHTIDELDETVSQTIALQNGFLIQLSYRTMHEGAQQCGVHVDLLFGNKEKCSGNKTADTLSWPAMHTQTDAFLEQRLWVATEKKDNIPSRNCIVVHKPYIDIFKKKKKIHRQHQQLVQVKNTQLHQFPDPSSSSDS